MYVHMSQLNETRDIKPEITLKLQTTGGETRFDEILLTFPSDPQHRLEQNLTAFGR